MNKKRSHQRRGGHMELAIVSLLGLVSGFLAIGFFQLAHLKPVFKAMPAPWGGLAFTAAFLLSTAAITSVLGLLLTLYINRRAGR